MFNEEKASYSTVNTARSALSTFLWNDDGLTIGKFSSVRRFMKGIYELRPPTPKYDFVWDVNIVLDYLVLFHPVQELPLCQLTFKLVMLLALVSAQRAQSLHLLNLENLIIKDNMVYCIIPGIIKQSSSRRKNPLIILKPFADQPALCVVNTLKEYLNRTKPLRKDAKKLFISFQKPYAAVSKETISRWLKMVLQEAGVDVDIFTAHSTRAASVSAAKRNGVAIEEILRTAGWANNSVFASFYDKPIQVDGFGNKLMA